jgi:hypothetical protein
MKHPPGGMADLQEDFSRDARNELKERSAKAMWLLPRD